MDAAGFGVVWPMEGCRGDLKRTADVSCSSLDVHMATSRNIIKMECTIAVFVVRASSSICKDKVS